MKALAVEGWIKAKPIQSGPSWRRVLRMRRCNPPRLTTKIPNPPLKKDHYVDYREA